MPSRVRGTQLRDGAVKDLQVAADAAIQTTKLADFGNFIIAGGNSAMGAGYTPSADLDVTTVEYVTTAISDSIGDELNAFAWQDSVLDIVATPPGDSGTWSDGDRYLVTATATNEFAGEEDNVAEYDGTTWNFITPIVGHVLVNQSEPNFTYVYAGGQWIQKAWESTEAGDGLQEAGNTISVKLDTNPGMITSAAGLKTRLETDSGLSLSSSGLAVLLNSFSLEKGASGVSIKIDTDGGLQSIETEGLGIKLDGTLLALSVDGLTLSDLGAGKFYMGKPDGSVGSFLNHSEDLTITSGVAGNTLDCAYTTATNPHVYINGVRLTKIVDYSYSATGGTGGVSQLDATNYGGFLEGDNVILDYFYNS